MENLNFEAQDNKHKFYSDQPACYMQLKRVAVNTKTMEDNTKLIDKLKFIKAIVRQLGTADGATTSDFYIANNLLDNLMEKEISDEKPLDKEDIESLGWKYTIPDDGKYQIDNYYSIKKDIPEPNKTTIEFKLRVFGDSNTIWSDNTDATYFDGKINNKSELKKIMEQIGL